MAKKQKRPIRYNCELYRMHFFFFINWEPEEFEAYTAKKFKFVAEIAGAGGSTRFGGFEGNETIVVWTDGSLSNLAHECVHAANFTLNARGVKADFINDEPQAYLVGLLFEKATNE